MGLGRNQILALLCFENYCPFSGHASSITPPFNYTSVDRRPATVKFLLNNIKMCYQNITLLLNKPKIWRSMAPSPLPGYAYTTVPLSIQIRKSKKPVALMHFYHPLIDRLKRNYTV